MDKVLEKNINESVGLIWEIAKKFYGIDKADLYQAGVLGIIKAYYNYRNDESTKFSTYAYKYIYGEMYLVANSKSIKVSKDILKLVKMIEHGRNLLAQKLLICKDYIILPFLFFIIFLFYYCLFFTYMLYFKYNSILLSYILNEI